MATSNKITNLDKSILQLLQSVSYIVCKILPSWFKTPQKAIWRLLKGFHIFFDNANWGYKFFTILSLLFHSCCHKKSEPSLPISKSFVNASGNTVHRVPVLQAVPVLASSNFSYQPTIFLYSEPSRDLSAQR